MVGVTLRKQFTYRGSSEEFVTQYWLTGATPSTPAEWRTLFNSLVTAEKTCVPSAVSYIGGAAHTSNVKGSSAVWTVDLNADPEVPVLGTLNTVGLVAAPGDAACWVRWKTSRVTSPGGKPVYLRKYLHPAYFASTNVDAVGAAQKTALLALGAKMRDGTFQDGRTLTAAGEEDVLISHSCSDFITTRTLKRRGKRRPS